MQGFAEDVQSAAMHEYYERGEEADRLSASGVGQLEFERTKQIVARRLPPPPATVADIGGGPGRYAFWLAGLGYRVLHRDVVPLHVAHVRELAEAGAAVETAFGDTAETSSGGVVRTTSGGTVETASGGVVETTLGSTVGAASGGTVETTLGGTVGTTLGGVVEMTLGGTVETALCDARGLDLADASVDAVLLLGPLYHLSRRADRVQALREAGRVARPGGPVFGAAISRWAPRLDGILRHRLYERSPEFVELIGPLERTGILPPLVRGGFSGFVHRPGQLRTEFRSAGLVLEDLVCVEGGASLLADLGERMSDPAARQVVLDSACAHERVPELLGLGPHLLATGRRA